MAWNEPGGGNRDPWGGKGNDQGPPDLDEVVKKLQDKMGGLFGGRGKGSGGGSGDSSGGGPLFNGNGKLIGIVAGVVVALLLLVQAFYIIQPAERGVVTRFGAYHAVTAPGPHLKMPFLDTVEVVNVDQINKFAHRAQMLTRDENIVDLSLTVQYRIQDPVAYLFQDANPEKTIHDSMESALREVVGQSNLDEIITENRSGVSDMVLSRTQALVDLYKTGLAVTNINIQDANPPDAVKEAFDDATRAREDKERLQNQAEAYANDIVPRARGAAAREVEDSKAYLAKIVAEAEGESERFLALLNEYNKAPAVTRERLYLETMQTMLSKNSKVLLDVDDGNNLTFLPLDRLMRDRMGAAADESDTTQRETATIPPSTTGRLGRDMTRNDRSTR